MGVVVPLEEKSKEAELASLMALTAVDLDRVNKTILSRTGSDVTMIPEVANHLISSGGKRLRPLLTLATAGLCFAADQITKYWLIQVFDVASRQPIRRG